METMGTHFKVKWLKLIISIKWKPTNRSDQFAGMLKGWCRGTQVNNEHLFSQSPRFSNVHLYSVGQWWRWWWSTAAQRLYCGRCGRERGIAARLCIANDSHQSTWQPASYGNCLQGDCGISNSKQHSTRSNGPRPSVQWCLDTFIWHHSVAGRLAGGSAIVGAK